MAWNTGCNNLRSGEFQMTYRASFSTVLSAALLLAATAATADQDCFVPMSQWQPRDAVAAFAAQQGWTVRRIKIDDGCYEVKGTDANNTPIEVKLDPSTLQILKIEHHKNGKSDDRRHKDRKHD